MGGPRARWNFRQPGPTLGSGGEQIREPRALTPTEIDEAVDNFYNNNDVPPIWIFYNEEGETEEYPKMKMESIFRAGQMTHLLQ